MPNSTNPYISVSNRAAVFYVILSYHSQSRLSSATTCQCIYAVVPICFHQKHGPGDQLQALSARLQTSLCRSRFSRQSIRRSSPIMDRYFLLDRAVPFHCHPTVSNGGRTSTETVAWVLDLAFMIIIAQMFDKVNSTPFLK